MTTPFWLNDPTVLMKQEDIAKIWPAPGMSTPEKLNAITRLVVILTILGYLVTQTAKIVVTGIVTLVAIAVLYRANMWSETQDSVKAAGREAFTNPQMYKYIKDAYTQPSAKNPSMNVLLPEINDDPHRKAAAPAFNPAVEKKINDSTKEFVASSFNDPKIDNKLFKDLGDSFTFDQSMRTWYATANTRVPNDQKAFAEYCYGDMISCKEGNELACTQSMPPRWTNN